MRSEHHNRAYRNDDWQVLRHERRSLPFSGTELDGRVDKDKIDKHPREESYRLGHTGRVEDAVDELPGYIRTTASR